ncbi:hypothetical protein AVEN_147658-1 [Araneus ventricosus]|uniref:Uncharacterized protein n=1 Tax=Araneus ventricosus TaxID=182803 RepID=A0A4Y2VZX4_ARAVE|nr:hypothetical protein AVEN_74007-1 [Araneus ventricosus]GBO29846.1 hypothetical protein AVEN_147658-1 [Araneus ventricosus]
MENDALISNIPENTKRRQQENTALAQINNTSRQQITNNNSNSTNNFPQRLTADQLAKRTSLQRDSSNSEDVQRRLIHLTNSRVFIPFLTGCDVA